MFERAVFFLRRRAAKRAVTSPAADMRLPAALAIGILAPSPLNNADAQRARDLGRKIQRSALASWPDILRPTERIDVVAIADGAAHERCDIVVVIGGGPERPAPRLRSGESGPPCVRLAEDDPECLSLVKYAFEPGEFGELRLSEEAEPTSVGELARIAFRPPGGARGAERIREFLHEGPPRPRQRFEYDLLLRLLGPREKPRPRAVDAWASAERLAVDEAVAQEFETLRRAHDYADAHAVYYGDAWRSAVVARSTLLLAPTIVSGAIGIIAPSLSSVTTLTQLIIILRIFSDRRRAGRERWQEKWIDYRDLAERLRCLRFLALCGGSLGAPEDLGNGSWVAWCASRAERAMTRETVGEERCADLLTHLVDAEIKTQIAYHRGVVRRFCALDLRLRKIARGILIVSAALGGLLVALGLIRSGVKGVPWPALTALGLSVAPALVANLNGFRGEFDMVRQGERSARAASGLARLIRETSTRPIAPAAIRRAANSAARIMIGDTTRWRSTLETRAARLTRR